MAEASALDTDLKKALASWLYKTALLVPLALSPRAGWPQHIIDECQAFYIRRRPPVGARVWIGRYDLRDNFPELVGRADVSELNYRRQGRDFIGNQILVSLGYFLGIVVLWNGVPPDDVNIVNRTDDRLVDNLAGDGMVFIIDVDGAAQSLAAVDEDGVEQGFGDGVRATAAAGDQPAPVSDLANDPDVLNVAADSNASASPVPAPRCRCIRPPAHHPAVMSKNALH